MAKRERLGCLLYRELEDNVLAGELLVDACSAAPTGSAGEQMYR